ncbi:MAG: hypothetical protein WDM87_02285 [Terracidiphilus sp.]
MNAIGFSQKICLPAFAACTIKSACVPVGVQISTASTFGSPITSSAVATTLGMPHRAATVLRGPAAYVGDTDDLRLR